MNNASNKLLSSMEELYSEVGKNPQKNNEAAHLLAMRDWFFRIVNFDRQTGQPLPKGLYPMSNNVNEDRIDENRKIYFDRVARIVDHCYEAVAEVTKQLDANILREHAMLPIYGVKEVDSTSISWLSRKPGRNVREKLSGKPYLLAVKRHMSIDNSENRLMKAFCLRMKDILSAKEEALGTLDEKSEDMLYTIQKWLRDEDSEEIGLWNNLPPNNKLLQHKHYRRLWDGWLWLQSLDEDVKKDHENMLHQFSTVLLWTLVSRLRTIDKVRIVEQPITFDYDNFTIVTEVPIQGIVRGKEGTAAVRSIGRVKSEEGYSYGTFFMDSGESIMLRNTNFIVKSDFDKVKIGTVLSYEVKEGPKGKLGRNIELAGDKNLELKLNKDSSITVDIGEDVYEIQIRLDEKNMVAVFIGDVKIKLSTFKDIYNGAKKIIVMLLGIKPEFVEPQAEIVEECFKANSVCLDICSVRPSYFAEGEVKNLPFRLMRQFWETDEGVIEIDLGKANTILVKEEAQVINMLSLFSDNKRHSLAKLRSAAMVFAEQLRSYFRTENITYLVPDSRDDFTLEPIRKSMNFYFKNALPLPRSIAAAFNWQSAESFYKECIKEGDYLFVLDCIGDEASITPLELCYNEELQKSVPETRGYYWERHPNIETSNKTSSISIAIKLLEKFYCTYSENVGNLMGLKSLLQERDSITWAGDKYFTAPENIDRLYETLKSSIKFPWKDFIGLKDERALDNNTYIIAIGSIFESQPLDIPKDFRWITLTEELSKGAKVLSDWQAAVGEKIPLWRDHLPELSIKVTRNGRPERFELVKDKTIVPQRGRTVEIPIKERFTLPAGKKFIPLDLDKGDGGKKIQYVAYLNSPAFPLSRETECILEMKYTYGADDSYELIFKPVDKKSAGFASVKAQWKEKSSITEEKESIPPKFPKRYEWRDFENFPGNRGIESLLGDWLWRQLDTIDLYSTFITGEAEEVEGVERMFLDISDCEWYTDRNEKCFMKLNLNGYGEIFLHENSYENFDYEVTDISLNIEESNRNDGSYVARQVTNGFSIPSDTASRLRRSIRFPLITVWDHAHSLGEVEVPDWFRYRMKESIDNMESLLDYVQNTECDFGEDIKSFAEEVFFILCCVHKDAPKIVSSKLLNISEDVKLNKRYLRHIAFAIGDAKIEWQKKLLENILKDINTETLSILAIALWRDSELIHTISREKLSLIIEKLKDTLSHVSLGERVKYYELMSLVYQLELLLALLRTRESKDEKIKDILSPNYQLARDFADLLEEVTEQIFAIKVYDGERVQDTASILKCHVRLQIVKPDSYYNTPDLLYALNMYLTGDSDADSIEITGVSEEN